MSVQDEYIAKSFICLETTEEGVEAIKKLRQEDLSCYLGLTGSKEETELINRINTLWINQLALCCPDLKTNAYELDNTMCCCNVVRDIKKLGIINGYC